MPITQNVICEPTDERQFEFVKFSKSLRVNSIARWQPTATGNPPAATLTTPCVVDFPPVSFGNTRLEAALTGSQDGCLHAMAARFPACQSGRHPAANRYSVPLHPHGDYMKYSLSPGAFSSILRLVVLWPPPSNSS